MRGRVEHRFLFTTDGFEVYEWAAKRLLKGVCIYGQGIKKRFRENRDASGSIVDCFSEHKRHWRKHSFTRRHSSTLNGLSFIERHEDLNHPPGLFLSCARRTPCHARRGGEFLEGQVALLMAYYNFLRPHSALRFGKTVRTPAMQAGLVGRRLNRFGTYSQANRRSFYLS